ncbi:MAG: signal peptidase II [Chitinophagales bacterium]
MISKSFIRTILIVSVIIINIGCDQVSKKIIRHIVYPYETIHLLSDHLTVTRVENSGAFLSTGDSLPQSAKYIFLSLIPLVAVSLGLIYVFTKRGIPNHMLTGLCFVIGGGIGNLFDRITYGSVTDFLHIRFGIFQTGIFNFADVSILTGILIILLQFLFKRKNS